MSNGNGATGAYGSRSLRTPGVDARHGGGACRLALDGIVFDRVTADELTGKVWEMDGWRAFRVALPGLEFVRGELLNAECEAFGAVPPAD
jgi:hypothetical protein